MKIDPRTRLFAIFVASLGVFLSMGRLAEACFVWIFAGLIALSGDGGRSLRLLILYHLQLAIASLVLPHVESPFFYYSLSFLTIGVRKLMPVIMAANLAFCYSRIEEWIVLGKLWRLPRWLLIPIAVIGRFFPALREDYRHIRQAMAMRGMGQSTWELLKHPLQTFEYILIPLLMNASLLGDDLTIAALTKGLGLKGKQTSLVQLSWTWQDWLVSALVCLPLVIEGMVA